MFFWTLLPKAATQPCGLASYLAQCCNGLSRTKAYRKLVLVSAADDRNLAGILSDPNHSFGVHKHFHAVHIFKHYKLHVASLGIRSSHLRNDNRRYLDERIGRVYLKRIQTH